MIARGFTLFGKFFLLLQSSENLHVSFSSVIFSILHVVHSDEQTIRTGNNQLITLTKGNLSFNIFHHQHVTSIDQVSVNSNVCKSPLHQSIFNLKTSFPI